MSVIGKLPPRLEGAYSTLVSGPAASLLTVAEVKEQQRISHDDEDTLIATLIQAATDYLDAAHGILGRALITQSWKVTLPLFPAEDHINLPLPRVQSVTSVTYYDADGDEQTLGGGNYRLIASDEDARLELTAAGAWPTTYSRSDAVSVTYVTGYGDAASDIPDAIRLAAMMMVGTWYNHRESVSDMDPSMLPMAVPMLLQPFRVTRSFF